jgi:hypothetical protein
MPLSRRATGNSTAHSHRTWQCSCRRTPGSRGYNRRRRADLHQTSHRTPKRLNHPPSQRRAAPRLPRCRSPVRRAAPRQPRCRSLSRRAAPRQPRYRSPSRRSLLPPRTQTLPCPQRRPPRPHLRRRWGNQKRHHRGRVLIHAPRTPTLPRPRREGTRVRDPVCSRIGLSRTEATPPKMRDVHPDRIHDAALPSERPVSRVFPIDNDPSLQFSEPPGRCQ